LIHEQLSTGVAPFYVNLLWGPYITYSASAERGHEGDQFFRSVRVPMRNRVEVGLAEAVIEWVRHGFGLSVLTSWALVEHVRNGLVATRPLTQHGLMLDWCAVVWHEPGNQLSLVFAQKLARWCATYPLFIGGTRKAPRQKAPRRLKSGGPRR
jgi:DNA-binding transcriptional LysR family regulator